MGELIDRQAANDWCHDCKEYDNDRHCCPRWKRVIRNTVEEIKAEHRWIPVTERLPEDDEEVIVSCTDDSGDTPFSYTTVAWHFKGTWICNDERCFFITAWMPLPEPYKGEK